MALNKLSLILVTLLIKLGVIASLASIIVRFGHFRRLVQCYERQEAHFLGMQQLAACVICARRVRHGRLPAEEFQPFAQAA